MFFSQLPAVEKDTENGASGKFFGPSHFVTALAILQTILYAILQYFCQILVQGKNHSNEVCTIIFARSRRKYLKICYNILDASS